MMASAVETGQLVKGHTQTCFLHKDQASAQVEGFRFNTNPKTLNLKP